MHPKHGNLNDADKIMLVFDSLWWGADPSMTWCNLHINWPFVIYKQPFCVSLDSCVFIDAYTMSVCVCIVW